MPKPAKFMAALGLAAGIFVAGYVANRPAAPAVSAASGRLVRYYACPMHPQYKSDRPGDAPCCGMRLEPVYADSSQGDGAQAALPKGVVEIGAARQQLIGVRTGEVQRARASHLLRVPGRITVDDARLYQVIAASDGWIRELGPATAGAVVKENQILASYYVREFAASQQALFYTVTNDLVQRGQVLGATNPAPVNLNLQRAIDTLRSLGMSDRQIEDVQRTRRYAPAIDIYSPVTGVVIARTVSPGKRFSQGSELYRIADITHVWVLADIFEKDSVFLKPGAMATVRYNGREFPARMSDVLPQFDPQSRTLKTRFELDNPGSVLRPDVFVDVELHVHMPEAVTVPADSIIDSGRRKTVFVERGNGLFEPRLVETGWRLGDRVMIADGLAPGERIVVSGTFLIDSESRMRLANAAAVPVTPALAPAGNTETDPVCGMDVDPKKRGVPQAKYGGKTWYFCSEHCRKAFAATPEKYLPKQKDGERGRRARAGLQGGPA